jgi:hypothetical protein
MGHVARMAEMKNAHKILIDVGEDLKLILKQILSKQSVLFGTDSSG